jgi:hypothetical protein
VLLVAVNLAAITFFLLSFSPHGVGFGPYLIDLDVYRIGGRVWLGGGNLYGVLPATAAGIRLPFSYPPIAAVLLSPLSLVPMAVAGTVLTLATVTLTALVLRVSPLRRRSGRCSVLVDRRLAAARRAVPRAGAEHAELRPGERRADGPGVG